MATRCLIAAPLRAVGLPTPPLARDAVGYIGCFHGELADAGLMLARHYRATAAVASLLRGGDLLALGATPETSRYGAHRPKDAPYAVLRHPFAREHSIAALKTGPIEEVYLANVASDGRVFWAFARGVVWAPVPVALHDRGLIGLAEFMEMAR